MAKTTLARLEMINSCKKTAVLVTMAKKRRGQLMEKSAAKTDVAMFNNGGKARKISPS